MKAEDQLGMCALARFQLGRAGNSRRMWVIHFVRASLARLSTSRPRTVSYQGPSTARSSDSSIDCLRGEGGGRECTR